MGTCCKKQIERILVIVSWYILLIWFWKKKYFGGTVHQKHAKWNTKTDTTLVFTLFNTHFPMRGPIPHYFSSVSWFVPRSTLYSSGHMWWNRLHAVWVSQIHLRHRCIYHSPNPELIGTWTPVSYHVAYNNEYVIAGVLKHWVQIFILIFGILVDNLDRFPSKIIFRNNGITFCSIMHYYS